MINNFYFFVLDYLESLLNLMIVSMLVLDSRQVGDIQNHEPRAECAMQASTPPVLSSLSTGSKYFKM